MLYIKTIVDGTWHDGADVYLGLLMTRRDVLLKRIILGARHVHAGSDGLQVVQFALLENCDADGRCWLHYSDTPVTEKVIYSPSETTRTEAKSFLREHELLAPLYLAWAKERFK